MCMIGQDYNDSKFVDYTNCSTINDGGWQLYCGDIC